MTGENSFPFRQAHARPPVFPAAVVALVVLLLVFRAVKNPSPPPAGNPVVVKDHFGREVRIPDVPRRIVSAAPSNTEILFALGLAEKVAAVTFWCDHPPEARELEKIGDIFPLNVERVLSFRPDLVLAHELNGKEGVMKLEELGIPVLAFKPDSFEDILEAIFLTGRATGQETEAEELVNQLLAVLERAGEKGEMTKKRGLKVYAGEVGGELLWAAGPGSFLDQAVTLAGGKNIAAGLAGPWGQFSMEWILQENPDVILLTTAGDRPGEIYADNLWSTVAAVRKRQVYSIADQYSVPGPRMIQALDDLAALLAGCR